MTAPRRCIDARRWISKEIFTYPGPAGSDLSVGGSTSTIIRSIPIIWLGGEDGATLYLCARSALPDALNIEGIRLNLAERHDSNFAISGSLRRFSNTTSALRLAWCPGVETTCTMDRSYHTSSPIENGQNLQRSATFEREASDHT
jgi:hypothetical protein